MSGPNGSRAYLAFARSTDRRLARGDLVLVHCNSYADGYWTDITRTYVLGAPSARQREMYDAVLAARSAALEAIRPGARAADVDGAARRTLASRGFGDGFRHGTGHEVGFGAVAHTAPPRLHPTSPDVLETGMVFNVEPAIYIDDVAGLRHCDVVAVTEAGARVLTPFQPRAADLTLPG
jgi:Xaa-Pro aminopeptidase